MTVRLPSIDHRKDNLPALRHADGTARCTAIADITGELFLARGHMDSTIRYEPRSCPNNLYGAIPHTARVLHERNRIAHACPRCGKGIHRCAMHRDDIAVGGDDRVIRIDLDNASPPHNILQPVGIRLRRSAVGAVIDDETILTALRIDPRDGQRHLVDLHRSAV